MRNNAMIAIVLGTCGLFGCDLCSLQMSSFTATAATVTGGSALLPSETGTVSFIAIVTNQGTNGIDGGTLTDTQGATYAPLESSSINGDDVSTSNPFTATLTYEQINQTAPISFAAPGGTREFVATFYDDNGSAVSASLTVDLACRTAAGTLGGSCGGNCTDIMADTANCGACGQTCALGSTCVAGVCKGSGA
jgi:hypothetical protein